MEGAVEDYGLLATFVATLADTRPSSSLSLSQPPFLGVAVGVSCRACTVRTVVAASQSTRRDERRRSWSARCLHLTLMRTLSGQPWL